MALFAHVTHRKLKTPYSLLNVLYQNVLLLFCPLTCISKLQRHESHESCYNYQLTVNHQYQVEAEGQSSASFRIAAKGKHRGKREVQSPNNTDAQRDIFITATQTTALKRVPSDHQSKVPLLWQGCMGLHYAVWCSRYFVHPKYVATLLLVHSLLSSVHPPSKLKSMKAIRRLLSVSIFHSVLPFAMFHHQGLNTHGTRRH